MSTIKFFTRSKRNPATIYVNFSNGRNINLMRSTPLVVNPEYFNNKTGKVRQISTYKERTKLIASLDRLKAKIRTQYNKDIENETPITSDWLHTCINEHFNIIDKTDLTLLDNYCTEYIEKLKYVVNETTGELGRSNATQKKYKTIQRKIQAFEKYKRKKYRLIDVNLKFREEFLKWMLDVEKLNRNTAGRYIRFIKTICLDAQRSGVAVSNELAQIRGFSVEVDKIYLSFDEINKIHKTTFDNDNLDNAKDWLVIGCYIGQRVSDLLQLTKDNLTIIGNLEFVELVQQKTKKKVTILLHPIVKEILTKRNNNFPKQFSKNLESSKTIFNKLIKTVCKDAGITEKIQGSKVNKETNRKEYGQFPKNELVTSHICRRSFATNHYGELPTPLLLNITGHGTEKEFLNYIGKTSTDYAEQMAKYWTAQIQKQQLKENNEPAPMRVAK